VNKETVTEFETGERLDKVLATAYPQYSRSALEKLITSGAVWINGEIAKTKYKVKADDEITVDLSLFNQPVPEIELQAVYEDDDVVVINKPAGVLVHAKGTLHNEATVATWLKSHVSVIPDTVQESSRIRDPRIKSEDDDHEFWGSNRSGIVHRLDRGTSGVMICAKNEAAQTHLQKQFSDRKAKKTYIALIDKPIPEQEGLIDIPIERNPKQPAQFRAGVNGKSAQTNFKVLKITGSRHSKPCARPRSSIDLESSNKLSAEGTQTLIELKPITGRTHQLRVHLAYLKCPIIGDALYEGTKASRLMLHAKSLELTLPSKERKTFESPVPEEITDYKL
jgi:23S rRNA pseudouridine1911/1915/1917 synthase